MKTNLGLKTSQQLALTPQLQQSIKLLQMSTVELREELESTILENPLLEFEENTGSPQIEDQQDTKLIEEGVNRNNENHGSQHIEENRDNFDNQKQYESSNETDYKNNDIWSQTRPSKNRISNDDPGDFRENLKEAPVSLTQHLSAQLAPMMLPAKERAWIEILIHALDSDGFLRESLEEVEEPFRDEFIKLYGESLSSEERFIGLKLLQSFDPLGIGAKDLSDCLRIQIVSRKELLDKDVFHACLTIVSDCLNLLAQHNISGLSKATGYSKEIVLQAENEIRQLNPRPGACFRDDIALTVIPDTIAFKTNSGIWSARLNESAVPRLKIDQDYARAIRNLSGTKELDGTAVTRSEMDA